MMETTIVAGFGLFGMVMVGCCMLLINRSQQVIIEAQQATIQKLLNREPVTYKEVGQEQPKPNRESYSAWGSQVVDGNESQ